MKKTRFYSKQQVMHEIEYLYRDEDEVKMLQDVVVALPFEREYGSNIESMLRNRSEHELASALFPIT